MGLLIKTLMIYTFHVVGLPHTQTTKEYHCCAYTGKVIRFCQMMKDLGHTVYLYGSEYNEAKCDAFIPCYPRRWHPRNYLDVPFDPNAEHWVTMNRNVIRQIGENRKKDDFICVIAGRCQQPIAEAFPDMMTVEFGVGYSGVFSNYKVFESHAWQHMVYGAHAGDPAGADGNFYDTVIPNYYEAGDFPLVSKKEDYFMYLGRLIDRKGWKIAQQVCEKMGQRLLVAGPGKFSGYGDYLGVLDNEEKVRYLGKAQAVFCPSIYIEPFCGVMAEAMLCGTPVISTPWGTFAENNIQGVTGYRCNSFREFCQAVQDVPNLEPIKIRAYALSRFSMDTVMDDYQRYFDHLYTLWGEGWYS
jgi:glycosyltransferase involved in cell wall biosynthesis